MTDLFIVDDDIENRQMVRSIVEDSKYSYLSISEADTVERGLILLKQHQPTIMIIDVSLPDSDGINFARAALELYPSLHIIVLTYLKMFETVQACINSGISSYLLKPVTKSELIDVLEKLLTKGLIRETNQFLESKIPTKRFDPDLGKPIDTAIRYIQTNFKEQITLKDVSDLVYLSPSHFSRLFKEEVGTTFVEYLTQYRIEKSKSLLKMTSLPIEVIANNVGFTSASYFATTFKRVEDKTPREYRAFFERFVAKN